MYIIHFVYSITYTVYIYFFNTLYSNMIFSRVKVLNLETDANCHQK